MSSRRATPCGPSPSGTTEPGRAIDGFTRPIRAACTEAPCLQVNYRYFTNLEPADVDQLIDDLRAGRHDGDIPPHGTLHRIRQRIPADRAAGAARPDEGVEPVWMASASAPGAEGGA